MKTAMILAAGRGERLKPLTDRQPKAMCLIQQKPLIEYHVAALASAGFERIVINHAYLGGQIRHHLRNGSKWGVEICYSPEPPGGLETGGGIYNALPLLGKDPFITVNADIFTDYQFDSLTLANNCKMHLVLVKNPKHNSKGDLNLINHNQLSYLNTRYTFSGIACYHPAAFERCAMGRYSVVRLFPELIRENSATGELFQGQWVDIGSLERLNLVNSRQAKPLAQHFPLAE